MGRLNPRSDRRKAARRGEQRRRADLRSAPPRAARRRVFLSLLLALGILSLAGWRLAAGRGAPSHPSQDAPEVQPVDEEGRLYDAIGTRPDDPESRLELARYYARKERLPEAIWEYLEAVASRSHASDAQGELALAMGRLGLSRAAIALLEPQVDRSPALRGVLAELQLRAGNPEQAVALLTGRSGGASVASGAGMTLGRAYLALGRLAAAREAFQQHARARPEDAEGEFWLGRVAWLTDQADTARRHWQRGADMATSDPRFPYSLGLSYAADGVAESVDRAGQAFDEAVRRDPRYVPALIQLGLLFHRHRRYPEAVRHFRHAIDIAPTQPEAHRRLADTLEALGERADSHRRRGLYYSLTDQPARALVEYERLQALHPDGIDAVILIVQSQVQMNRNEQAVTVLERALKRHPRHPALLERLATLSVLLHTPREAEAVCREWLRGDAKAARAYWVLGRAAFSDHRVEEARRHYETAVALAPADAELHYALGGALEQIGRGEDRSRALTLLRRAVELAPRAPDYRYRLGIAYQQRGEWEAARRELLAAIRLEPGHTGAYNSLTQVAQALQKSHQVRLWAQALRSVQERHGAETRFRLEAGARPCDPAGWFALAQTLLREGAWEKAHGPLEQALWLRPDWPEARRALARITALRAAL
jgi:tetratricopeptide (TPR) repeat protein